MAIIDNPRTIELEDIQGLITRGYGKYLSRTYFLLEVNNAGLAKEWLKTIAPRIDDANYAATHPKTIHIAFTAQGLQALGLSDENLKNFPIPFREGMITDNRSRLLGDYKQNSPEGWRWGKEGNSIHILMILHAKNEDELAPLRDGLEQEIKGNSGIGIVKEMPGFNRADQKEPFGFHDGISQPTIEGSGRPGPAADIVKAGEFILGYHNEYDEFPFSPLITEPQGEMNFLAPDAAGSGKKDLGRNGSFLVYRQMEQHVDAFWSFMEEQTKNADGSTNEEAKVKLASKCVGRWPSGASLAKFPDADPGGDHSNNDFGYADDPDGLKCPFGSHLRRNNPRDSFRWYDQKQSLKVTKRHRIMRRGSSYEIKKGSAEAPEGETGLHFVCFNANIEMQFEFIQHAWANNRQLRHLTNDIDVIVGVPPEHDDTSGFTVQKEPVNEFVEGIPQFVTIKGGSYFFFPGISAFRYLTTL
jgi:Dyp-type peroxidase family